MDDEEVRGESTSDGADSGAEDVEGEESDHGEEDGPDSISTLLANDEVPDKMEESGHSGLDQVVEDEEHEEGDDFADKALGAVDEENEMRTSLRRVCNSHITTLWSKIGWTRLGLALPSMVVARP